MDRWQRDGVRAEMERLSQSHPVPPALPEDDARTRRLEEQLRMLQSAQPASRENAEE